MKKKKILGLYQISFGTLCRAAAFRLELTCVTLKSQQACEELVHSCFSDLPLRYLYFIATLSCISGNCDVLGRQSRALVCLGGEDQPLCVILPFHTVFTLKCHGNFMCCTQTS